VSSAATAHLDFFQDIIVSSLSHFVIVSSVFHAVPSGVLHCFFCVSRHARDVLRSFNAMEFAN